jgi:hypothetical protein
MDAELIGPQQWNLVVHALPNLVLFVAMMVNGAISFLLSHAIIPSLEVTNGLQGRFRVHRFVLYAVSAASMSLMLFALYRGVILMTIMLRDFYPRFAI